jgi:hypothetical protein
MPAYSGELEQGTGSMDGRLSRFFGPRPLVCAVVLLSITCGLSAQTTAASTGQPATPVAESTRNEDGAFQVFIRIQSDMDRLAAGKLRGTLPAGTDRDPLENLVDAYAAYLQHDDKRMDAAILVAKAAAGSSVRPFQKQTADAYMTHLVGTAQSTQPLLRLMAAVRAVDGTLYLDVGGFDPMQRKDQGMRSVEPQPAAGLWLRLPCRTLREHMQEFVTASQALQALPGPLLDCPSDNTSLTQLAAIASQPGQLKPHQAPAASGRSAASSSIVDAPASTKSSASASVDTNHNAEEASLKQAAAKDVRGELDYALFLHAFRPQTPARDAQIQHLLDDVQAKSYIKNQPEGDFQAVAYDGSDKALIPRIILASMGEDQSVFQYPIPCDVLKARPALLEATKPYYGSNKDNFLPQSGCGTLDGYPAKEVEAFKTAATDADGHFIDNFDGSMVYAFEKQQNEAESALQIGPGALAAAPGFGAFDYPYQAWGYLSLNNYRTSLHIKAAFEAAQRKLADYYGTSNQSRADAMNAARNGLFALVFGGDCGQLLPSDSTRRLLLEGAPLASIQQALSKGGDHDDFLDGCAKYGGIDPLMLIAAGNNHEALDALLAHGEKVDVPNNIGKTPLMEASQFNQLQSVAWLLEHGADPNASIWSHNSVGSDGPLQHDARTPLMYAAANGSLTIIEILVSAGADPYQTDSKGYRAIDYLLGYGPTSPNPVLSDAERAEAQTLLY